MIESPVDSVDYKDFIPVEMQNISSVDEVNRNVDEEEVAQFLSEMRNSKSQVEMRNSSASLDSDAQNLNSNSVNQSNVEHIEMNNVQSHSAFISRVSQHPVVNSTLRTINEVYSSSKNTSSVLKYSAETMESSFKSIIDNTKPVLDRFEPRLGQLDNFACKQLDRLEKTYPSFFPSANSDENPEVMKGIPGTENKTIHSSSCSSDTTTPSPHQDANDFSVSRWNSYLSIESARTLQFCLEWLNFAIQNIDKQINMLRNGINRFMQPVISNASPQLAALSQLSSKVKIEVVETLKKVVNVMSKYAGNVLPFEAKRIVRGLILSLPNRWALINSSMARISDTPSESTQNDACLVLKLAEESNSMLRNTMAIFGQTVSNTHKVQPPSDTIQTESTLNSEIQMEE